MFNFTNDTVYKNHPITLYNEMDKKFHSLGEWISWEPEVLLSYFPEVSFKVPKDKLLAIQAAVANSQLPCSDHTAFESIGNCFCNYHMIIGESQPLEMAECFYTVGQLEQLVLKVHGAKTDDEIMFIGEIPGYVASVAKAEHQRVLPVPLKFGQDILDYLYPNYNTDLTTERKIISQIDQSNLPESSEDLEKLLDTIDPESKYATLISWVLGCYFYNPTSFDIDTFEDS